MRIRVESSEQLGKLIKNEREKIGLSQIAYAEKIGVTAATIYGKEQGRYCFKVEDALDQLGFFGYRLEIVKDEVNR